MKSPINTKGKRKMSESEIAKYKAAVIAAATGKEFTEPDAKSLQSVGKLRADFAADTKRYQRRLRAIDDLARLPEREREVAALEKAAASEADCGDAPTSRYATIRELRDALRTFEHRATGRFVSDAKLKAHEAKMELNTIRAESNRMIAETCDPTIGRDTQTLAEKIRGLQRGIESRREFANLEAHIENQESLCNELVEGKGTARFKEHNDFRPARELLKEARQKLAMLISMRPQVEAAKKQDDAAHKEIADLQKKIDKISARRLLAECMDWGL
jgi:hypothetical protein